MRGEATRIGGFQYKSGFYRKASECVTMWFLQQPSDRAVFEALNSSKSQSCPLRIELVSSLYGQQKTKELRIL